MSRYAIILTLIIAITCSAVLAFSQNTQRWKPLSFDNPGTRKVLKTEQGSYYYYRSLPEKTMTLNTQELVIIEVRALSTKKLSKPQFTIIHEKTKKTYELKVASVTELYTIYEPMRITLAPEMKKVELLCYERELYFRAFFPVQVQKKKPTPAFVILKHEGEVKLANNSHANTYYKFSAEKPLTFQVNKNQDLTIFIRAHLIEKDLPVLEIYKNGELLDKIPLSLKRTKTYSVKEMTHLTIGKKLTFPADDAKAVYELRPVTKQTFIARPLVHKKESKQQ